MTSVYSDYFKTEPNTNLIPTKMQIIPTSSTATTIKPTICTGCEKSYNKKEVGEKHGTGSLIYIIERCSWECHHKTNWDNRFILTK